MYTTDHIFPVLPIKHLVNHDSEPTTPHKLATSKKTSVSNPCVLFCLCLALKVTAHIDTKSFKMCHLSQKRFWDSFVGIPQHQKGASSTYIFHGK